MESMNILREIDDKKGLATSLNNLGLIAQTRGDFREAEWLYRQCLTIAREIGDQQGEATFLSNLGVIKKFYRQK